MLTEKDQLPPYKGFDTEELILLLLDLASRANRDFPEDARIAILAVSKIRELENEIKEIDAILKDVASELDDVHYLGGYEEGIKCLKMLAGEWQPAETAPLEKNILVFENPQYGDQSIQTGICLIRYDEREFYIGNKTAAVTHWQPLPSPPAGA